MGIKLNRSTDGLVRVMSVANLPLGSPILRKGDVYAGDLVREAGGVDLRRPITATMWGDTVALIKMAPRPLKLIVAEEVSGFDRTSTIPKTYDTLPTISTGPERIVTFTAETMGIKLNRGTDGIVRVLSVVNFPPGSPNERQGEINAGDLVREAGGVDLRRPIDSKMWEDTCEMIKNSRPIQFIIAKELGANASAEI